ncbi:glycosyltransferase family 4 protein [Pedobacter puniceum]|jgi:glycosyltransferase involved in cell wall biosynthesis|uniref:Glycosyltransferase n=1 Tax=Pedobacter puniceum TaxID=2666136 RepID=A0A7K0FNJ7_9SPHI|nr:glycosyltransferase family 4 protein [Pedobacter puniceum]MRX47392.1 glycosyltransferase [Pedobacter puniceum]
MKKVLFITPFFGRNGSEMQLMYILKNLDVNKIQPYLFSRNDGELLKELPYNFKYFIGYKKHKNFLYRIFRLLLYTVNINPIEFQLKRIHKKVKPDIWYINTLANRDAFIIAKKLKVKVISHIHELPLSYNLVKSKSIQNLLSISDLCIGCSAIVCEKLADMGHKNVKLLYGFIDDSLIKIKKPQNLIKNELNIKGDDFVWIISGRVSVIKGVDYLIPLIKKLKANHKVIWIGDIDDSGTVFYALQSIQNKFIDRVKFIGKKSDDYYDYFNIGDAFLSLSREDSYPLVMLEAAHLGKPIVGFNSGGIKEFVQEGIGYIIDSLNYDELAFKMHEVEVNYNNFNSDFIKEHARKVNLHTQSKLLNEYLLHI